MTRFAWLQSRMQTLTVAGVVAGLVVVAAITGIHLAHLYDTLVADCHTGCDLATSQFLSHDRFMEHALDVMPKSPRRSSVSSGAPRCWPGNLKPAAIGSPGRRA